MEMINTAMVSFWLSSVDDKHLRKGSQHFGTLSFNGRPVLVKSGFIYLDHIKEIKYNNVI